MYLHRNTVYTCSQALPMGTIPNEGGNSAVTDQVRDNVGWMVRERRVALDLSQTELARRLGMKREYLSQIESGKPKWPQKYIPGLARELGISPTALAQAAGKIEHDPTPELVISFVEENFGDLPYDDLNNILLVFTEILLGETEEALSMPVDSPLYRLHRQLTERSMHDGAQFRTSDGSYEVPVGEGVNRRVIRIDLHDGRNGKARRPGK